MFILNITKNKLIASVCGVGALVLILFFCLSGTFSATDQTVDPFAIEDSDCARRAFIESYGIALSPNPPAVEKADIPEEFDESYKDYEMLQNEMGLSLYDYRGKNLTKYTYEMTNHPESYVMPVYVNLFVYHGRIAAADVCAPNLKNGFLKSLEYFR